MDKGKSSSVIPTSSPSATDEPNETPFGSLSTNPDEALGEESSLVHITDDMDPNILLDNLVISYQIFVDARLQAEHGSKNPDGEWNAEKQEQADAELDKCTKDYAWKIVLKNFLRESFRARAEVSLLPSDSYSPTPWADTLTEVARRVDVEKMEIVYSLYRYGRYRRIDSW